MPYNKPIIAEFQTESGNKYVYDAVTNRAFFAPDPMSEIIRCFKTDSQEAILSKLQTHHPRERLEDYYEQVQRWVNIDEAFFTKERALTPPVTYERDRCMRADNLLPHLVLVMTNDCNFRCTYCPQDRFRESMSFSVAKAGIDRFIKCNVEPCQKFNAVGLSFYGGEPLLEFDVIRKSIEYFKSRFDPTTKLVFSITTNGSLITDEIIDCMVENDVQLCFSLDGPKHVHDKNRLTKDGKGTFDLVYRNITRVKERYPSYYTKRCKIFSVYDREVDIEELAEWFVSNQEELPPVTRVTPAGSDEKRCHDSTCKLADDCPGHGDSMAMFKKAFAKYKQNEEVPRLWKKLYPGICPTKTFGHVPIWSMSEIACWPGKIRLTLNPNGDFDICDRLDANYPIGNIHNGIDVKKIDRLISHDNRNFVNERGCHSCFAQYHCMRCFKYSVGKAVGFTCELQRNSLVKRLIDWFSFFEKEPESVHFARRKRKQKPNAIL